MQTEVVFSFIGAVLGATVHYVYSRHLESKKSLTTEKSQAYVDYLKASAGSAGGGGNASAADARARIVLFGSPSVAEKLVAFERGKGTSSKDGEQGALVALLNAMREDLVGKAIPEESLRHVLPNDKELRGPASQPDAVFPP